MSDTQEQIEATYPCTLNCGREVARPDGICSWCFRTLSKDEQIAHLAAYEAAEHKAASVKPNGKAKPSWEERFQSAAKATKEWNKKSCAETEAKLKEKLEAPAALEVGEAAAAAVSEANGGLEMPEDCMYGEAKVYAGQMHISPGLGYPALLGAYSVKPEVRRMCGVLLTMYVALIARVGGGKNVAMDRAQQILGLTKFNGGSGEYAKAAPGGIRGLFTMIGDKPSGKRNDKSRVAGARKLLLLTHEMSDVLKMTGLENSTLASRLCDLWDDPEFQYPTKDYVIDVNCRLSWIGGVPCTAENPTRFTELFDSETSHGLYDRLYLGYSEARFNYKPWEPPSVAVDYDDYTVHTPPYVESVEPAAQAIYDAWKPWGESTRAKQLCLKVAVITAMMNHERTVGEECMKCAVKFMEWQMKLKKVFQPGEAVNDAARLRVIILDAMKQKCEPGKYINLMRLAHDRKWAAKFGDWLVKTTISNLVDMKELVPKPEPVFDKDDTDKVIDVKDSKTMFTLRDWKAVGIPHPPK